MITQAQLMAMFQYEPDTGNFIRLIKKGWAAAGSIAGAMNGKGYISIEIEEHGYLAHRLAWLYVHGSFPEGAIDHKDRNKSNNRLSNLRLATDSENKQNRFEPQKNNTSGFLGVTFHKTARKWLAQIKKNRKVTYLGLFETPEAAHFAYLEAKRKIHLFAA